MRCSSAGQHVDEHRQAVDQVELLEDEADAGAHRADVAGDAAAVLHGPAVHCDVQPGAASAGMQAAQMWRSSVDLPEPEAPISATISPAAIDSDTPCRARRAPNVLLRSSTSMATCVITPPWRTAAWWVHLMTLP